MKFAIVVSQFNSDITEGLYRGSLQVLSEAGFEEQDVDRFDAPGAFEIPLLAKVLAGTGKYTGIICLGAVIKGETAHFEFISLGTSMGLMQTMLETKIPVSFGIITTYTDEQAIARSQADSHNKGREAALACLQTARTLRRIERISLASRAADRESKIDPFEPYPAI